MFLLAISQSYDDLTMKLWKKVFTSIFWGIVYSRKISTKLGANLCYKIILEQIELYLSFDNRKIDREALEGLKI